MPNDRFICLHGHQYWINGEVVFNSEDTDVDGTYRTIFGPSIPYRYRVWRNCNRNQQLALRRLLGCIEPETPGADAQIRANQVLFIAQHLPHDLDELAPLYEDFFADYTNYRDEVETHLNDVHPKRELRIKAFNELIAEGKLEDQSHKVDRHVQAKVKTAEKAKYVRDLERQKYPRMIFDLKIPASLVGSQLIAVYKAAMAENPLSLPNANISFIKSPDPNALADAFRRIYDPPKQMEFICFSDDAGMSVRLHGRVYYILTDISSADASYTPALFHQCKKITPPRHQEEFQLLIDQCEMPMKIKDQNQPHISVKLKPRQPVLYSGSGVTTLANTRANMNIARAFAIALAQGRVQTPEDFVQIAREAGYIITITVCEHFEDFQFLKHSPVRDTNGEWQPLLNPGVLMRASGMCYGDLPGRGPLEPRALAFQRGLLQGAYPYASFSLLDAMWQCVGQGPVAVEAAKEFAFKVTKDSYPPFRVDESSLALRYRLEPAELDYACELLSRCGYGYSINCSALEKIGLKDYDLPTTDYEELPHHFHAHV